MLRTTDKAWICRSVSIYSFHMCFLIFMVFHSDLQGSENWQSLNPYIYFHAQLLNMFSNLHDLPQWLAVLRTNDRAKIYISLSMIVHQGTPMFSFHMHFVIFMTFCNDFKLLNSFHTSIFKQELPIGSLPFFLYLFFLPSVVCRSTKNLPLVQNMFNTCQNLSSW